MGIIVVIGKGAVGNGKVRMRSADVASTSELCCSRAN